MRVAPLAIALLALALAGCAGAPLATGPAAATPWHDQAFAYDASLVGVSRQDLFRLDPELARQLAAADIAYLETPQRVTALMRLIYGPERTRFAYVAGESTPAARTWQRRRGDCLSLTVLTYAAARAVGLDAQMQEVRVPAVYDRRAGFDHVNRHVNVLFPLRGAFVRDELLQPRAVVIDFEPEYATRQRGLPLTDDGVLARFYNNLGVEFLARGQQSKAYAHFKAAIAADASFAPAYGNLSILYRDRGLAADAEQLLRRAIALSDQPDVPLQALHQLLADQGRTAEARAVAARLRQWQESDPYYWVAQGIRYLDQGEPRRAVDALEQAESLTTGFAEVHRYLALAYWRLGERKRAGEQLALLSRADPEGPATAKLRRKFSDPASRVAPASRLP